MFSKKNRPKLSEQERRKQADLEKEQKRRGEILRDKIYPLLVENTESVQDAQIFIQSLSMAIEQAFLGLKRKTTVQFLNVEDDLKSVPEADRYHKLFEVLNVENVDVATDLLASMGNLITNNLRKEQATRKLSDLPIEFITHNNG